MPMRVYHRPFSRRNFLFSSAFERKSTGRGEGGGRGEGVDAFEWRVKLPTPLNSVSMKQGRRDLSFRVRSRDFEKLSI